MREDAECLEDSRNELCGVGDDVSWEGREEGVTVALAERERDEGGGVVQLCTDPPASEAASDFGRCFEEGEFGGGEGRTRWFAAGVRADGGRGGREERRGGV